MKGKKLSNSKDMPYKPVILNVLAYHSTKDNIN